MSLPTLLIKGSLKGQTAEIQKELDEKIPIDYIKEWFRNRMELTGIKNRVLILKAETASGKSTVGPPSLFQEFLLNSPEGKNLICTQPRVLTAIENVNEIVKYNKFLHLGKNIVWRTKYNKLQQDNPRTSAIISATIGTLSEQLKHSEDERIKRLYRFILIDETHERDIQTDITIAKLKEFLLRNQEDPECPFVVLMSATFDPDGFLDYFGIDKINNFIWCTGATAEIIERWDYTEKLLKKRKGDVYTLIPETVKHIIENEPPPEDAPDNKDILVFLPGAKEMKDISQDLARLLEEIGEKHPFVHLNINSQTIKFQTEDYKRLISIPLKKQTVTINNKEYTPQRRVILSTNVAETGLTLPELAYVIDTGINREIYYDPIINATALKTCPASQSNITQRRGRVGRKYRGVYYPLFSKESFNKLRKIQFPQILTNDISEALLDILPEEKLTLNFDMLDNPAVFSLQRSVELYNTLGIAKNGELTALAPLFKIFRFMPFESIRMILAGYMWKVHIVDLIIIATYISMPFQRVKWEEIYRLALPSKLKQNASQYHKTINCEFINGIFFYQALMNELNPKNPLLKSIKKINEFCEKFQLPYEDIIAFLQAVIDNISSAILNKLDINANKEYALIDRIASSPMEQITRIKHCIYDGYRNNLLTAKEDGYYTQKNYKVYLYFRGPKYILYNKLYIMANKTSQIGAYDIIPETISVLDDYFAPLA